MQTRPITADEFQDFFPLDYAFVLASGLRPDEINQSSRATRQLRDWATERLPATVQPKSSRRVGLRVCRDVLRSLCN